LYLQGFEFWTVQLVAKALLRSSGKVQLLALPCMSLRKHLRIAELIIFLNFRLKNFVQIFGYIQILLKVVKQ